MTTIRLNVLPALDFPPIALVAGRGDLPDLLIETFRKQKRPFVVLAFTGQTDPDLLKNVPHLCISFGEIGKGLNYFAMNHIKEIVMAGAMTRPKLSDIHPDWEGMKWIAKIGVRSIGDDGFLRAIVGLLEEKGYKVVGPDDVLQDLLAIEGALTSRTPDEQAWSDIQRGAEVLEALSPVDVGQAVVVQDGFILGIEAIEGTDALIKRSKALHRPGLGGVLVKMSKTHQERRVDLPTIGPKTIKAAQEAGLRGIAVQTNHTLLLNRNETLKLAEEAGIFLYGVKTMKCAHKHP